MARTPGNTLYTPQIVFYGVESNAACAAYAFAASFNRIVALSAAAKLSREVILSSTSLPPSQRSVVMCSRFYRFLLFYTLLVYLAHHLSSTPLTHHPSLEFHVLDTPLSMYVLHIAGVPSALPYLTNSVRDFLRLRSSMASQLPRW